MSHSPKVSIIITNYNYGQYLKQALESALAQDYSSIEVIVVDDGSTDNSAQVLQPYLKRIAYIGQPNSGVVAARNNGAAQSSGDYIIFLDADDYLPSNFVSQAIKTATSNSSTHFVYSDMEIVGSTSYRQVSHQWNSRLLLISNYIGLTTLIHKAAFDSIGGFKQDLNRTRSYEDWDLWLTLSDHGFKGQYDPQLFFYYRKEGNQSRNQANPLQKALRRLPLIRHHLRSYIQPSFLVALPSLAYQAYRRKVQLLSDKSSKA